MSSLRHQRGVTLLEVLIAVFVLSIGLLGLATLQFKGLRNGQHSYQRSQAALLAFELTDFMRASRTQALAGSFVISAAPTTPSPDCSAAPCTPAEFAAYDRHDWYSRVTSRLPLGSATVTCASPCGAGKPQVITIKWDENRTGTADSTYQLSFAP